MSAGPGAGERVVLLDEAGRAIGTELKADVHHASTPLHLAFSCYLFEETSGRGAAGGSAAGGGARMLLTRRAGTKTTWPGVWTNGCCGHPGPDEPFVEAAARRVRQELGVEPSGLRVVLPGFRYRAVMDDGVVENEMCPVLVGRVDPEALSPDPAEVGETAWVDWAAFRHDVLADRREVSPWCVRQVAALPDDPLGAPTAVDGLPPAALG